MDSTKNNSLKIWELIKVGMIKLKIVDGNDEEVMLEDLTQTGVGMIRGEIERL